MKLWGGWYYIQKCWIVWVAMSLLHGWTFCNTFPPFLCYYILILILSNSLSEGWICLTFREAGLVGSDPLLALCCYYCSLGWSSVVIVAIGITIGIIIIIIIDIVIIETSFIIIIIAT